MVVYGGDGSLVWVLKALDEHPGMKARPKPTIVAVQPLGTGNDMSRYLRWGSRIGSLSPSPASLVESLETATVLNVDSWRVSITPPPKGSTAFGVEPSNTGVSLWVNYMSFGVDAKVVQQFENCRGQCGSLFCCAFVNKAVYSVLGGLNCCHGCHNEPLANSLQVEADQGEGFRELEIPEVYNATSTFVYANSNHDPKANTHCFSAVRTCNL